MNCATARALIDQGYPQRGSRQRSDAVVFHLASCAECRAYRASLDPSRFDDTTLLHDLLSQRFAASASPQAAIDPDFDLPPAPIPATKALRTRQRRSLLATTLRWIAIVIAVCLVLFVAGGVYAVATIRHNVQALIVTPAARPTLMQPTAANVAQAAPRSDTSTPVVPTARPSPSPQFARSAPLMPTLMPTSQLVYPPIDGAINVLLIGSDARPDDGDNARGDAIMVMRIDPQRQRIALLSLPRDLIVSIPGYGQARINAAQSYGGVELTRNTVSNLLGIPIDFYATVNFEGFIAVVDAVGGVDVQVEKELYDPEYPTMDYGYTVAHFLPGMQHMDGATALMYSRVRHPDSDYDRIKRQQQVLVAIGARVQQQNVLQSVQSLMTISGALRGYVQTDMSENTMLSLAWSMRSLSPSAVERYALGGDQVSEGVIADDPYASFALPGAISLLVQQFVGE